MPSISYDSHAAWSNYHLTIGDSSRVQATPHMTIEQLGRFHAADVAALSPLARFAATARTLLQHLTSLEALTDKKKQGEQEPLEKPFAAGMVGCGWSFAPLIGTPVSQLMCDGLAGVGILGEAERHDDCSVPAARIALVGGGTRLREIVAWSEPKGMTIATSGTHLGPTIAGAFGTASHGSRLGFGGLQNIVLGMHTVVGSGRHVWIERASCPVLSDDGLALLAGDAGPVIVIRDDEHFENALVHLGGMGIVNGVAIELVPNVHFAKMLHDVQLTPALLKLLDSGSYGDLARALGCSSQPDFYELTIDPLAPFGAHALHTMYFPTTPRAGLTGTSPRLTPADAIAQFATRITSDSFREALIHFAGDPASLFEPDPDPAIVEVLRRMFKGEESGFNFYRLEAGFAKPTGEFDPHGPDVPAETWGELHGDEITGGQPGALYNASFAIPRHLTSAAIPAVATAVRDLSPCFVFTLRFVSDPAGTLAFTRFEENMVLEIDGLSPLICRLIAAQIPADDPYRPVLIRALEKLGGVLEDGSRKVREALEASGIPYSMHWAKLGSLDRAKVQADFGTASSGDSSLIAQWQGTRDHLLSHFGRQVFWNEALISYGVLERPEF